MILAHHPDCECAPCAAWQDVTCGKPAVGFVLQSDDCQVCVEHAAMAAEDPEAYGKMTYFAPAIEVTTDRRSVRGWKRMIIIQSDGFPAPFGSYQDHELTDEEIEIYRVGLQADYPGCTVVRAAEAS
jgi:hypothetical protein